MYMAATAYPMTKRIRLHIAMPHNENICCFANIALRNTIWYENDIQGNLYNDAKF